VLTILPSYFKIEQINIWAFWTFSRCAFQKRNGFYPLLRLYRVTSYLPQHISFTLYWMHKLASQNWSTGDGAGALLDLNMKTPFWKCTAPYPPMEYISLHLSPSDRAQYRTSRRFSAISAKNYSMNNVKYHKSNVLYKCLF